MTGTRSERIRSDSRLVPEGSCQSGTGLPNRATSAGEMQGVGSGGRPDWSTRSFGAAAAASAKNAVRPGLVFSRLPRAERRR